MMVPLRHVVYYDRTIISIDTLKNDIAYRTHLEKAYWDIIVIDEAQNVATRGERKAQRARLAELLATRSDTMIMLSATPHDGRPESFASLMNMLDRTAIANIHSYTKDDIKGLCIRRFKKDVQDQMQGEVFAGRILPIPCKSSAAEESAYCLLADLDLEMDRERQRGTGQLFQTTLEKALFSSPAACQSTVRTRLRKLRKKYGPDGIRDIAELEQLEKALAAIGPRDFSRYQALLVLLRGSSYAWQRAKNDRLVIFTERVDTMNYLYEHLQADLDLEKGEIEKLSGAMSDEEQQRIVEAFGRSEEKVRLLVASDVASEGLNLHYQSHRLIHFDLPWSLMVFQQRNGRIDRYGQTQQPDIRYLQEQIENEKIGGDRRLLEILMEKEEQAQKNIGDPAALLGKFASNEEEQAVAAAIESGTSADDFAASLDRNAVEFDPLQLILGDAADDDLPAPQIEDDHTLFTDTEYLYQALQHFNQQKAAPVKKLTSVLGLDVALTDDLRRRINNILPAEVAASYTARDYLRFVSDSDFCQQAVRDAQNSGTDAWPEVQYLWPLNPVFDYVNEKASLIYARGQVPLAVLDRLPRDEVIFLLHSSIPNQKSTPLVDKWFALRYEAGAFAERLTLEAACARAHLSGSSLLPNVVDSVHHHAAEQEQAQALVSQAVAEAEAYLSDCYKEYQQATQPKIDAKIEELGDIEERHRDYQLSLFEGRSERLRNEKEKEIDEEFDRLTQWVTETMTIENHPYIRILAVLTGSEESVR